jgi:hypothetical protein
MSHGSGYGVVLFNLDKGASTSVAVSIDGLTKGSKLNLLTYGKAQYDRSKSGVWAGPVAKIAGGWKNAFTVALPAWSMTSIIVLP